MNRNRGLKSTDHSKVLDERKFSFSLLNFLIRAGTSHGNDTFEFYPGHFPSPAMVSAMG